MSNGAKVALTGRLIKEPTSKVWQGTTVVSFSMAVNTTKKENDKYVSDLYNVSVWGKSGEFIMPKIKKGSLVQVFGDLIVQKYKDKNDVERQSLSVRAIDVYPLSPVDKKKEQTTEEDDEIPPF